MKKIKFLAVMLCIVTLGLVASCSKDKDYSELIVGKWKCTASSISDNVGRVFQFTADGILTIEDASTTYSISGSTITISFGADGQQTWEIKKLTEKELSISVDNSPYQEVSQPVTMDFEKM